MAMLVVLLEASECEQALAQGALAELARLGISTVSLVRDERTVGFVLEGWAFDPARSADAVRSAVAGADKRARTLHQLVHMAVSTASVEGGFP